MSKEILSSIYSILSHLILDNSSNYNISTEKELEKLGKLIDEMPNKDKQ